MPVGQTKTAGWQVGVSRTVPFRRHDVWEVLSGPEGLGVWLGRGVELKGDKGERYHTTAGVSGEVRSFGPGDRVRLTWRPPNWDHDSTVQVALREKGDKTVVQFHQERLASAAERDQQRRHWQDVADNLGDLLHRSLSR